MTLRSMLNHIELILSAVGLLVIVGLPALITPQGVSYWQVTALTAATVGLLHGVIFWLIRRRQRLARQQSIACVREMLQDVLKNQLAIITLNAHLSRGETHRIDRIQETVDEIVNMLDHISEESLQAWRGRYQHLDLIPEEPRSAIDRRPTDGAAARGAPPYDYAPPVGSHDRNPAARQPQPEKQQGCEQPGARS